MALRLPARFAAWTATAPAAATTFMSTSARACIRRLRTGFIHRHATTHELGLVQLRDGLLRLFISAHLDERETTGTASGHVAHHAHGIHGANPAEELFQLAFRDVIRKISDKQLTTHSIYSCIPEGNVAPIAVTACGR
jgi:hypothetical protein